MRKILTIFILLISLYSCQTIINPIKDLFNNIVNHQTEKKDNKNDSDKPTIIKSYYEKSKTLKSEITVKNKKKNGPAKEYYPTGELRTLVNYVDNVKVGETIWYYKNGQPYRVTPYVNGKMDGIRKKYYEDGALQAEIPYKKGELKEGTLEYENSGELKVNNQRIIFEIDNYLKSDNKYFLKIKLKEKSRKVEFFEEKTSTEGNKILVPIKTNVSHTGVIEYNIPKGSHIRTVLKVFVKYETKLRNPVLISDSYNLVIENK